MNVVVCCSFSSNVKLTYHRSVIPVSVAVKRVFILLCTVKKNECMSFAPKFLNIVTFCSLSFSLTHLQSVEKCRHNCSQTSFDVGFSPCAADLWTVPLTRRNGPFMEPLHANSAARMRTLHSNTRPEKKKKKKQPLFGCAFWGTSEVSGTFKVNF